MKHTTFTTEPLVQITSAFRRLSEENKLRLLEHLAAHTDHVDEICEGLRTAALAYGRAHSALDDEGDEAEAIADSLIPQLTTSEQWDAHDAARDATLRHALTPRDVFGRAAA